MLKSTLCWARIDCYHTNVTVTPLSWQGDLLSTLMHLNTTPSFYKQLQGANWKSSCFLLPFCFAATSPCCAQAAGTRSQMGWVAETELGNWDSLGQSPWEYSCQAFLSTSACKEVASDVFHNGNLHLSLKLTTSPPSHSGIQIFTHPK